MTGFVCIGPLQIGRGRGEWPYVRCWPFRHWRHLPLRIDVSIGSWYLDWPDS